VLVFIAGVVSEMTVARVCIKNCHAGMYPPRDDFFVVMALADAVWWVVRLLGKMGREK
jgi:hypothetical protein